MKPDVALAILLMMRAHSGHGHGHEDFLLGRAPLLHPDPIQAGRPSAPPKAWQPGRLDLGFSTISTFKQRAMCLYGHSPMAHYQTGARLRIKERGGTRGYKTRRHPGPGRSRSV